MQEYFKGINGISASLRLIILISNSEVQTLLVSGTVEKSTLGNYRYRIRNILLFFTQTK